MVASPVLVAPGLLLLYKHDATMEASAKTAAGKAAAIAAAKVAAATTGSESNC